MKYRNKIYKNYASRHVLHYYGKTTLVGIKRQFPVWTKYYREFLPTNSNAASLDIGCGNGGFVYWLQKLGYKNVLGIDASAEQVQIANDLGIKNIIYGDFNKYLKGKHERFEIIFALDVIEHFNRHEILALVELIYKSLNKNGKFVIQTPNGESPFAGRYRYGDITHEMAFTSLSLRQVLVNCGFSKVLCRPVRPVSRGLASWIRTVIWRWIEGVLKFYIFIETGQIECIFTQNIIACGIK